MRTRLGVNVDHVATIRQARGTRYPDPVTAAAIAELPANALFALQAGEAHTLEVDGVGFELESEDVLVETVSVEGLEASSDGQVTIGLRTELTPELEREGLAREILNRVQTLRKDSGFEVSDRITLLWGGSADLSEVVSEHGAWIAEEVLAPEGLRYEGSLDEAAKTFELPGNRELVLKIERISTQSSRGNA